MAAGPITHFNGDAIIGAPTVHRLRRALSALSAGHLFSLYDTAHAVLALEDGTEKEGLLVKLAAEALYYSNNLREEREARQNDEATRTVTLTPETYGTHAVRFIPETTGVWTCGTCGLAQAEPEGGRCAGCGAGAPGVITVTSIDKVVP